MTDPLSVFTVLREALHEEGRRVRTAKCRKKTPPEEDPAFGPVGSPGFRFGVHTARVAPRGTNDSHRGAGPARVLSWLAGFAGDFVSLAVEILLMRLGSGLGPGVNRPTTRAPQNRASLVDSLQTVRAGYVYASPCRLGLLPCRPRLLIGPPRGRAFSRGALSTHSRNGVLMHRWSVIRVGRVTRDPGTGGPSSTPRRSSSAW